jgi:putative ABC transport system permease protein
VGIFGIIILSSVINVIHLSILIPWWLPIAAVLLTTSLSMLLAAYIVFYYTKQDVVEALRYE